MFALLRYYDQGAAKDVEAFYVPKKNKFPTFISHFNGSLYLTPTYFSDALTKVGYIRWFVISEIGTECFRFFHVHVICTYVYKRYVLQQSF